LVYSLFRVDSIHHNKKKGKSFPVTGLEWPGGFHEVTVPRFHDNGTGRW